MTLLTALDVRAGCVISRPGYYRITEDILWEPAGPNARAIAIEADDVTLDLGGFSIRQTIFPTPMISEDPHRPCKGTLISGNVAVWAYRRNGIRIKNGSVLGVQGVGICLQTCRDVDLSDLTVRACGGKGVVDTTFLCRNGGIFVIGEQRGDDAGGIAWSSHVRMRNCVCLENSSDLDFVVTLGSLIQHCENVEIRQCSFHRTSNRSSQPSGVQFNVVGIDLVQCRNVLVQDCEAHDNTSGGEPAGFFAWGENITFRSCRANRNFTITGNRACGFNFSTSMNIEVIDCVADGNYNANPFASQDRTLDFAACGFRVGRAVERALFRGCVASGNHSAGRNSPVAGFMLNSVAHAALMECIAIGNYGSAESGSGAAFAAGFMASMVLIDEHGLPVGGSGNTFIDCLADANSTAGFLLNKQRAPKIFGCRVINHSGAGIWLIGSRDAIVEGCFLAVNTADAIRDESPAGTNLFVNSKLRLNGSDPVDSLVE
jgi:hypothetical protein